MTDPRILKLADTLVNYSVEAKKGEIALLRFEQDAQPLAKEVYKLLIQKGVKVILRPKMNGFPYIFYKYASDDHLAFSPKSELSDAQEADVYIGIGAETNTKELTTIEPSKMSRVRKTSQKVSDILVEKRWVICDYPTHALAQDAGMSLEEFEDFAYSAMNSDYSGMAHLQEKLKKIMDEGSVARIVGKDTDIIIDIKDRQSKICCGKRNIPDGEVFLAPVETNINGHILFDVPSTFCGREVENVYIEVKDGIVIKATAQKNQDMLHAVLSTDEGSKRFGEFGIGTNYNLKTYIRQILFDEKIGGTIHMALGSAYSHGGGKNKSAIHWDLIKDLRKEGEIFIDGKCIQKNGVFLI